MRGKYELWTEKSKFELCGSKRSVNVKRNQENKLNDEYAVPTVKQGGGLPRCEDLWGREVWRIDSDQRNHEKRTISFDFSKPHYLVYA